MYASTITNHYQLNKAFGTSRLYEMVRHLKSEGKFTRGRQDITPQDGAYLLYFLATTKPSAKDIKEKVNKPPSHSIKAINELSRLLKPTKKGKGIDYIVLSEDFAEFYYQDGRYSIHGKKNDLVNLNVSILNRGLIAIVKDLITNEEIPEDGSFGLIPDTPEEIAEKKKLPRIYMRVDKDGNVKEIKKDGKQSSGEVGDSEPQK